MTIHGVTVSNTAVFGAAIVVVVAGIGAAIRYWGWLKEHSPSIQAIAAMTQGVAALILVAITARYVSLTATIARDTEKSLQVARESSAAASRESAIRTRPYMISDIDDYSVFPPDTTSFRGPTTGFAVHFRNYSSFGAYRVNFEATAMLGGQEISQYKGPFVDDIWTPGQNSNFPVTFPYRIWARLLDPKAPKTKTGIRVRVRYGSSPSEEPEYYYEELVALTASKDGRISYTEQNRRAN